MTRPEPRTYTLSLADLLESLPPLPRAVESVLDLVRSGSGSVDGVASAIEADPGLSDRIVRLVGGACYSLSWRVSGVRPAVSLLGFRSLENVLLSIAFHDLLVSPGLAAPFDRRAFWRHSVATAAAAAALARRAGRPAADYAHTAGLLHDVGKIVLARRDPVRSAALRADGDGLRAEERAAFGVGHDEAGALLAGRWGLMPCLADAIRHHHASDLSGLPGQDVILLTAQVAIADRLAWDLGFAPAEGAEGPTLPVGLTGLIDVRGFDRDAIREEMRAEIDRMDQVLPVESGRGEEPRPGPIDLPDSPTIERPLARMLLDRFRRCEEPSEMLLELALAARTALRFDRSFLFLARAGGLELDRIVGPDGACRPRSPMEVPIGRAGGPIGRCARDGRPFAFPGSFRFPGASRSEDRIAFVTGVPILAEDRVLAVVVACTESGGEPVAAGSIEGLEYLARELGRRIETYRVEKRMAHTARLSLIDELTGLPNRRSISAALAAEFARARNDVGPVAVALVDLDRFKESNDAYGREAGDRILVEVGAALRGALRKGDACGRFEADAFLLVFPETGPEEAVRLVERARSRVEEAGRTLASTFPFPGGPLSLSAGVAVAAPEDVDARDLLRRAERALRSAKVDGRGRIACEEEELERAHRETPRIELALERNGS